MENEDNILEIVQNIYHDIRAEVVIADLIENGLNIDDIVSVSKGIFKRRYTRDIEGVKFSEHKNGQKQFEIHLNRDGLYDALPEGLFHERSNKADADPKNTSKESKKAKQEEKAARDFFLPFENEIFRQGVQLELEERKLLSRFSEKLFDDIYPEIWNLHGSLPKKYIHRLALLLHFAHKITGNKSLMAKCLETILEEQVEIRELRQTVFSGCQAGLYENNSCCVLGEGELGVDFVCGEQFTDFGKTLEFIIGPLRNTKVSDYLINGGLYKFLDCFYDYFVPVDFDVKTSVNVNKSEQGFELKPEGDGFVLGYETTI